MTKIIAFSGRKQSGKTTSGEYVKNLLQSINPKIRIGLYSFADPLKKHVCMDLLGLTEEQCYGNDDAKNSLTDIRWCDMPCSPNDSNNFMTAREVMEYVGTSIFRKMKNTIWFDATRKQIIKDKYDIAILVDNRFPNEVDPILENGGYVVRLTRNPFNSDTKPEVALDRQNYDWSKFSLVIDNEKMSIEQKNNHIKDFLLNKGILTL